MSREIRTYGHPITWYLQPYRIVVYLQVTGLRTRAFQAHSPSQKVSMLAFLVNGLTWSNAVHSESDKNMDHMTNLWKDKSAVEDKLRKLWSLHNKRTEQRDSSVGGDDSKDQAYEEEEEDSRAEIREEEDNSVNSASVEELEKQIEKLWMQQNQITKKLLHSHSQPSLIIGQGRYMRRYWLLPGCGGVFVEGIESSEGYEELKEGQETAQVTRIKEEQLEEPIPKGKNGSLPEDAQFLRSRKNQQNQKAGGGKRGRAKIDSCGSCAKKAKLA
ncbi:bromodomain adjacent to zinc finger domain protein 2B [Pleuronectes platessa]|uniref:bromodomain adjacent to zinc finger domain protein 2B n=1 Tax=Pleuronectes platessa TaxID=8262 RepID=UPI00232A1D23|nr:bromodomain adjacent to zinc finger domain protein 2B [Pleuronectes platessa]